MLERSIQCTLALTLLTSSICQGTDYPPKLDNQVICVELKSGKLKWEFVPSKLSSAHFEQYPRGVVMYPHYSGDNKTKPTFLDPNSGKVIPEFKRDQKKLFSKSAVFWPGPVIALDNGWQLKGFSAGNHKTLVFRDAGDKERWKIPTGGYPHQVRSWKNLVFYAFSYLSNEGILYAYRAGEKKPTWTLDLNSIVKGRSKPLTRMIFQLIEDKIYLEANEHIFCIQPMSGKVLWHRNVAKDLGLNFAPDLFGGGLNLAVFGKSGDVLIISFECRVVALDLKAKKYLWHLQPDTFPHCPFPLVLKDSVILSSGAKRALHRVDDRD